MSRGIFVALMVALSLTGCNGDRSTGPGNTLTGRVTISGQPLSNVTIIASGPENKESSGLTDADGRYQIENPPAGLLTFKLSSMVPPAPPGTKDAPPPQGMPAIPAKYAAQVKGLQVEYRGGTQTYDVDLK